MTSNLLMMHWIVYLNREHQDELLGKIHASSLYIILLLFFGDVLMC